MLYLSKTLSAMVLMRMYEVNNVLCTTGKTSMGWATLIVLFRRDDMRTHMRYARANLLVARF
jgi:hypothetical protein